MVIVEQYFPSLGEGSGDETTHYWCHVWCALRVLHFSAFFSSGIQSVEVQYIVVGPFLNFRLGLLTASEPRLSPRSDIRARIHQFALCP